MRVVISSIAGAVATSFKQEYPLQLLTASQDFFPLLFPLPDLPPGALFFLPCPSISRWPARSPSMASVFAVKPEVNFLLSLACFSSLAFLGVIVREPFLVIPDDLTVAGLDGFLIRPCAMIVELRRTML